MTDIAGAPAFAGNMLALALVPNALPPADWTMVSASLVPPQPITVAMLAEPAPQLLSVVEPPPLIEDCGRPYELQPSAAVPSVSSAH